MRICLEKKLNHVPLVIMESPTQPLCWGMARNTVLWNESCQQTWERIFHTIKHCNRIIICQYQHTISFCQVEHLILLSFLCLIFFLYIFGRGLGPWGPNIVRKYTSARFGTHSTGEILTEEESTLLTGIAR